MSDTFAWYAMIVILSFAGFGFFGVGLLTSLGTPRRTGLPWMVALMATLLIAHVTIVLYTGRGDATSTSVILGSWLTGIALGSIPWVRKRLGNRQTPG